MSAIDELDRKYVNSLARLRMQVENCWEIPSGRALCAADSNCVLVYELENRLGPEVRSYRLISG